MYPKTFLINKIGLYNWHVLLWEFKIVTSLVQRLFGVLSCIMTSKAACQICQCSDGSPIKIWRMLKPQDAQYTLTLRTFITETNTGKYLSSWTRIWRWPFTFMGPILITEHFYPMVLRLELSLWSIAGLLNLLGLP